MNIFKYELGELQANCYFLIEDNKCLIIDPADEASFILEKLQREKLDLVAMLATHGHFDHIMAVGEIQLSIPAPFYINEKDLFLVKRLNETAKHFLGHDPVTLPPNNVKILKAGMLHVSSFMLQVIPTPGHTPGSVCLLFDRQSVIVSHANRGQLQSVKTEFTESTEYTESVLFTGDTLFKGTIGRYDFSYSDKNLLDKSLSKLFKLPKDTVVYPGHGEESTISEEKAAVVL